MVIDIQRFSFQKFKFLLIGELTKVFPNEMQKYRALRSHTLGDDKP